jgi:hypothetical protein
MLRLRVIPCRYSGPTMTPGLAINSRKIIELLSNYPAAPPTVRSC